MLEVEGILNATTNYLLDTMTTRGIGFDTALREAQLGGFTEADPRNDTEGWDTACKLLILANFVLGADLTMDELTVEGIQSVTAERIEACSVGAHGLRGDNWETRCRLLVEPKLRPQVLAFRPHRNDCRLSSGGG